MPLFILFSLFAFGTGFVLVTASQTSTERRSKASGIDPYATTSSSCESGVTDGNGQCISRLEYMNQYKNDWRCNGPVASFLCPKVPIELSPEDYNTFSDDLPKCTPAREFAGIMCK